MANLWGLAAVAIYLSFRDLPNPVRFEGSNDAVAVAQFCGTSFLLPQADLSPMKWVCFLLIVLNLGLAFWNGQLKLPKFGLDD